MIYGGDGLARLPANEKGPGKAVFVPFVLAHEKIDAELVEQKSGFARAQAREIVEASTQRVEPECPYFGHCGGCQYQHAGYEAQLVIKKQILEETLRRTAKLELATEIQVHPSPPWNYRNRSRLQIRTRPDFAVGYFKHAVHDVLPIEQCPISSPLINQAVTILWQSGRRGEVPAGVEEAEFFADAEDAQLLVEIWCTSEARRSAVRGWAEALRGAMPQIAGVVAFRTLQSKATAQTERLIAVGADHLTYKTPHADFRVSAGSFFQTNRFLIDELVKIATAGRSGEVALDLYAGVGLFSTALGDFHHTFSVESSQTSSADLTYNLTSNGEAVQATTEQYLARQTQPGRVGKGVVLPHIPNKPDLAVVDPPRSGLGERVARLLADLGAPRVTYVSCDPATLARDLVVLLGAGYTIEQIHLVDLFPQTYHLETVVHLVH